MKLAKLRSGMRRVAGVDVPRQDRTSHAFKKLAKTADRAPDAGVADGSSARMRTDRPHRAKGGRVGRWPGGPTEYKPDDSKLPPNTRLSEDSLQKGSEAQAKEKSANRRNTLETAGQIIQTIAQAKSKSPVGSLGHGLMATGHASRADRARKEARDAKAERDDIESAKPISGEEDRKSGGRVKKRAESGGNWIAGATQNKGALHRALKVPMGEKIPAAKLNKAADSSNPTMAKRANLAKTLKGLGK